MSASTPFTLQGDRILFSSGAEDRTILVRFAVAFDDGQPALQAGDGLQIGLFRTDGADDTCLSLLGVAGWSLVYQAR